MADRNLRVRIGLDTSGLTAAADAAAAALGRLGAAAQAAGSSAAAGSERASAASRAQAEAAKASAVTQESLVRSTAQAAVRADVEVQAAAERTAAAQVAAAEAMAAAYEAAYRASALAAAGASEAEIAAARSVVAAQATAATEAAAAVKTAAAEETAAAEASAAAQVAAAQRVAEAQAIAATAALPASRAAAAEARAASIATVAANRAAAAEATAAAGAVEGAATRAAGAGSMMGLGIAAGAVMIGKSILTQTRDYDLAMNTLQGVTGSSTATMKHAGDVALQLGADITIPGASAADAAHAMLELSKAGFTVVQSEDAAKASLQLAATAQVDAGKAAEFMGASLNMFGLNAGDATRVADVLAATANAASGNITDFMYSMNAAGPASHTLGISLEDTATAMAMLAKAGILGSNAGTEYARMLQSMEKPTKNGAQALKDLGVNAWTADGQFRGLPVVIDALSKAHARMTPEAYAAAAAIAFGAHAVKAAVTLGAEGLPVWADMAVKVHQVGANADMATAMMQGLPGAIENIKNNASNLALTVGHTLSPMFEGLVNTTAAVFGGFATLPHPVMAAALALGAVTLLRGPLMAMSGAMTGFVATTRIAMTEAGVEMGVFRAGAMAMGSIVGGVFTSLKAAIMSNPIGLAIIGITTAISLFSGGADKAAEAADKWNTNMEGLKGTLDKTTGAATAATIQMAVDQINKIDPGAIDRWRKFGVNTSLIAQDIIGVTGAATANATALEHVGAVALGSSSDFVKFSGQLQKAGVSANDLSAAMLNNDFGSVNEKLHSVGLSVSETADGMIKLQDETGHTVGTFKDVQAATEAVTQAYHMANEKAGMVVAGQKQIADANSFAAAAAGDEAAQQEQLAGIQDAAVASATGASYATIALGGAFKDGSISAGELKTQVQGVMTKMDELAGRNGDAEASQRAFNQSVRDYSTAQVDAAAAPRAMTEAQLRLDDATARYNDTLGKRTSKTFTQADKDRELKQLTLDIASATDGVSKAQIDQSKAADGAAQKTADLQSQYISAGQSAYNTAMLQGRQKTATDEAATAMQKMKDAFIAAQPQADITSGKAQHVADVLFGIPKDTALTIQAQTGQAVTAIQMLNGMKVADKNFQITAHAVATGPLAGGIHISSSAGGAGTITFADGGMYEAGMTHAADGLLRQPMMVTGGRGITWAEPETGWEAYISGKPGQEAANRKILGVAAGRLGMSAVMGSDGASNPILSSTGNTYSPQSTHNVYHGGMGTGNLEAAVRALSASLANGASRTTQLAEHLQITNTTSDGTAGLNRVLALMPRR